MGGGNSTEISGVRVFKVTPASPASEAGLEVFFDFILEINGVKMDPSGQQSFAKVIQDAENGAAKLQVFNTRAHTTREVVVNPRKWAGTGLLGATVRFDVTDPAENHGIRVLEVFPNSPAAHAGLVPFQDFLLGTAQSVFREIDELVEVVQQAMNQRIQIYVYNADTETVREVTMAPNNDWGGDGCIGCDIGTGLLHRIPAPRRMPGGMMSAAAAPHAAQWAPPPAGIQPPAYPPGVQMPPAVYPPGVQMPAGIVPPAMPPAVPQAVPPQAMPAPVVPGVPVPTVPAGLPGIAPSGVWPPQAQPTMPASFPPGVMPPAMPAYAPGAVPVPGYAPGAVPMPPAAAVPVPVPAGVMPPTAPQVPAPAPVPVPVPVSVPVPAPVAAATEPAPAASMYPSQSEELAQLQARIQQLGGGAGGAAGGVKWPPLPQQAPVAPQLPISEIGPASPCAGASPTSPETPAAGMAGRQAPPCTPLHASDAPVPTDLSQAMDPAAFANGPTAVPESPGAALL